MSEFENTASAGEAPPKKRVPTWVWIVGGGCLFLLAIAITGLIVGGLYVKRMLDPAVQWPRVAKVVPFDREPDGWTIMATPVPVEGADIWMLTSKDAQRQVMLMHYVGERASAERTRLFDPTDVGADVAGLGKVGRFDPKLGTIHVQGREIRCVRTNTTPADSKGEEAGDSSGADSSSAPAKGVFARVREGMISANLTLDITPLDAKDELTVVVLTHRGTRLPVPDEEAIDFLKPFRVGPEHK